MEYCLILICILYLLIVNKISLIIFLSSIYIINKFKHLSDIIATHFIILSFVSFINIEIVFQYFLTIVLYLMTLSLFRTLDKSFRCNDSLNLKKGKTISIINKNLVDFLYPDIESLYQYSFKVESRVKCRNYKNEKFYNIYILKSNIDTYKYALLFKINNTTHLCFIKERYIPIFNKLKKSPWGFVFTINNYSLDIINVLTEKNFMVSDNAILVNRDDIE